MTHEVEGGDAASHPQRRADDTQASEPTPEASLAEERRRAAAEITLRTERIRALSEELRSTRTQLRETSRELARAQRDLATLRRRRAIRLAITIGGYVRPVIAAGRRVRSLARLGRRSGDGSAKAAVPRKRLRATAAEDAAFRRRLAAALLPSSRTDGPLVSAIVPTRDGIDHLRRLMPALDGLAYRDLEVIVVDNGSRDGSVAYLRGLSTRFPIRIIQNTHNRSFSEANNQGAESAKGDLLLLINNDAEPAGPHVLGHMVDRLLSDPSIVAVGSRLVFPRRRGPTMGSALRPADLSLQHRGIRFATEDGMALARNVGGGEDPLGPPASEACDLQAATAACLLIRRTAFDAVDGFTLGYDYGMEDVDLSLKLRAAGGRIVYEPQATFWHHESATQHEEARGSRRMRHEANRHLLGDIWGPRVTRQVLLDKLSGGDGWAAAPLHVGITVTSNDPAAGYGDWYTAHELGEALEALGWRVSYLERRRDAWYEPDTTLDVVVALLDAFDVHRMPEGIVRVAWVRNWTERWLAHPWFDEYDIVLASSHRSRELIDARSVHVARLMPLATNPARFRERDLSAVPAVDVAFTTNRWGEQRGIETIAPRLASMGHSVAVYGKGWEAVPAMAAVARGPLAYDDLPAAYGAAALVVDDTASSTLPYGAVNSRVFDALATGTLVITDNVLGARELFGDAMPAADGPEELVALVDRYLADPDGRRRLAGELRRIVLERHTYRQRAVELRDALAEWARAPHIDIAIGSPRWENAENWGDYHFGRALQRALQRRAMPTRLRLRSDWDAPAASRADAVIHVFGLAARSVRPGQLSVVWIISHPDLVTDEMVGAQDFVFVASDAFAGRLARRTGREVQPLHQATDPDRFRPVAGGPEHELLFVANSRGVRRWIVDELTPTDRDLAVFGRGWTPELLDTRYLRGEHIPNDALAAYYTAASVVLNDHWPDMAAHGFLSNRLYDAAACGAFIVSDHVAGIEEEFDGGVVAAGDGSALRELVARFLDDPEARAALGRRARAAVLAHHTFGHRADEILRIIGPALAARPMLIVDEAATTGEVPSAAAR